MERIGDGQDKMEEHCSTGQSPQRAVAPTEEEEEEEYIPFSKEEIFWCLVENVFGYCLR